MTINVHKPSISFCGIVQSLLPWKFRRLLVLAGTYGALSSMEKPLREHAQELSEVLNLASNTTPVTGLVQFHSILVSRFDKLNTEVQGKQIALKDVVSRKLSEDESRALADKLVRNVHPSLLYKQPCVMIDDLMRLFAFASKRIQPIA